MKLFTILALLFGAYYWVLIQSTDMVMDQTMQMHRQYQAVAEQADQIAVGNH